MGKTRVALFTVFTCISLTSQTFPTKNNDDTTYPEGGNDSPPSNNAGLRSVKIDVFTTYHNYVLFNMSNLDPSKHQYRIKIQPLACEHPSPFRTWKDISKSIVNMRFNVRPYTNMTLEVQDKITGKIIGRNSTITHAKEPEAMVTELECNTRYCIATIDDNCWKYNDYNMTVQFTLKPSSKELRKPLVTKRAVINSEGKAEIPLKGLDLLPFTNYTVTATLANNMGVATNSSLTNEASFTTMAENPGKVSRLAVTHSTPNSLHVEWSPPADDPPKGKLKKYELVWNIHDQTSNKENVKVKHNIENFTITGLEPNTLYDIKIRARNANQIGWGEPACIMNSTMEGASDSRTGREMSDAKTSLSFSWKDLPHEKRKPEYYTVTFSGEGNYTVTNTIATDIKFDGLTPGKMYTLKVVACYNNKICQKVEPLVNWTKPEEPQVIEKTDLQTTTATTLTIQLPVLEDTPGKLWVLLKKYNGSGDDENIKKNALEKTRLEALDKVRRKSEEEKNGKKSNGTQANGRNRRSANPGQNDDQLRVVAEIEVEEGKEPQDTVEVGGDWNDGKGLDAYTDYVVFIVTETRAGPYSEYKALEPRIMRTKKNGSESAILGMIAGMCVAAVFLICLLAMLVVKCKTPRKQHTESGYSNPVAKEDKPIVNPVAQGDAVIMIPGIDTLKSIPPKDNKFKPEDYNTDAPEEDLYANVNQEVRKEDLEKYLPRAIHASETTMEFNSVPFFMPGKTAAGSRIPKNVPKNRYKNDISYDDTRVKLPLYHEIPHSDYINANYVKDPSGYAAFIATQGPKDNNADTTGAFWRMIWHSKCRLILMVANLVEGGKMKVAQYWPEKQPMVKEGVKVTLKSVQILMDYAVRTFTVAVDGEERMVKQYHYMAWPDHGVPQTAYGLSHMLKTVIKDYEGDRKGPITVHCSAGIGRTGTIILTLFLLHQIRAFNAINTKKALRTLREGRGRLVENTEQYIFVHKLLYDILFGMKTTYSCQFFVQNVVALCSSKDSDGKLVLEKEYEKMKKLPKDLTFKHGSNPACTHLNRNQAILPADKHMVFLQRYGTRTDSQYMNIVRVNGFDRKNAYLAGEHPQPNTLPKIWQLVYEHAISVWLLLQELPENDPSFPNVVRETSAVPSNMTLEISKPIHLENFIEYTATLTEKETDCLRSHKCTLLMLKGWPHFAKLPCTPFPILGAIEKAESLLLPQTPLLFTCSDGVTACGVTATLLQAVCRAKLTQEVDLYRSAVSVQYNRPEFITDLMQYQFLFTAMEAFLNVNNHYGNFT